MPSWPYSFGRRDTERHTRKLPPFYSLEADLPVLLTVCPLYSISWGRLQNQDLACGPKPRPAISRWPVLFLIIALRSLQIVAGFQHSIAMLAGVITPPIIFANALNLAPEVQSYMISASLIASGILSAIQMSRIRLPIPFVKRDFFIGTGLITVLRPHLSRLFMFSPSCADPSVL